MTLLVYAPSLRSDFVSDARLEIEEGFVTSLANLPKVVSLQVLGMHLMLSDRPGEMLYLMLNAALWGKMPFGYHLSSVLLHAANVALLLILLRRLAEGETWLRGPEVGKTQFALLTATLIFALHPIATESVAEVSFSSSLLVVFFTLLGLLAALHFRPERREIALLAGAAGTFCAFAAVLAKESGIAVALLLIVYWFLFRRREARGPWFLFFASALAVTAAVMAAILSLAVSRQMNLEYLGGSFDHAFLIQPQLWVFMMGQLLWPANLSADYPLADMNLPAIPLAWAILAIVAGLQAWLAWRSRIGALGVAIYWLGLVTVSNFLPLFCIQADRFYYLPLAGVALQLAAVLLLLLRSPIGYGAAIGALLAAVPFLSGLTIERQAVFANEIALWSDTLKKSPHSCLACCNYGLALFQLGRTDEAEEKFEQALAIDEQDSSAHVCIGFIEVGKGHLDRAIAEFQRALEINPRNGDALCNLGIAYCQQGRFDEGIAQFNQALAIDHDDASSHTNLALALAQTGRVEPAIQHLQIALQIDPNNAQAHDELGDILARRGQPNQAAEQYLAVLKIKPNEVEARMNLGVIYLHQGRFDRAIAQFEQARQARPDSADILDNLGVALAQKGDTAGAIARFQEALRLKPGLESAQINLAKAEAAARGH